MKKNYNKFNFKTKQEWLDARGIGGSSAAMLLNKSTWGNANDVYTSIVSNKVQERAKNSRMEEGTKAEPCIRQMFALEHPNYDVTSPPKEPRFWMFKRKDYPLLTLTPDGLFKDKATGKMYGLEIKDVEMRRADIREAWESNTLPDQYFLQCLHYMVVMNDLNGVCLVARMKYYKFDDDNNYIFDFAVERAFWIYREDFTKEIAFLEKKEIEFVTEHIIPRIRPKVVIKM